MPRSVEITVPPERTDGLVEQLRAAGVLSLRLQRGISLQPPGDVVAVEVTDANLTAVMRAADRCGLSEDEAVALTTSRPLSVVNGPARAAVARDSSVSSWEEIDLTLGRESTMTSDKVIVMALAGLIAGLGIATEALHLVVGAMVIAPGAEPLVRLSLGLVHRSAAWRSGLSDAARGYVALAMGAAAAALLSHALGTSPLGAGLGSYLGSDALVAYWSSTTWAGVCVSTAAGVAGALLIFVNRTVLTAGVMIALALVPSLTLATMALVSGELAVAGDAALRWLVDVALVVVTGVVTFQVARRRDGRTLL